MEDHLKALHHDIMVDIMSRLEGCTLAATASTCRYLRDTAKDGRIWQKLCHETWPSTSMIKIASPKTEEPGFKSLYCDAFPLILYQAPRIVPRHLPRDATLDTSLSPYDFTSLVDIFYDGHSIFSKGVVGIAESSAGTCCENLKTFLSYPFELDLLGAGCPKGARHDVQDSGNTDDSIRDQPISAFIGCDERDDDLCNTLAENIRLSWILLNTNKSKAVNISNWKPLSIHRDILSDEDYTFYFGCAVATEDDVKTRVLREFVIMVNCKLMTKQRCIRWKEISLVIKDTDGSHLSGEQSMRVMNQALVCSRSINHDRVHQGYQLFQKHKRLTKLRTKQAESFANIISATTAIATLLGIGYACAVLL